MSRLAKRLTARPGAARQSAAKEEAERERMRKNNRLCVAMVVIFGTCWLPLNTINFVADVNVVDMGCFAYYHLVFFLCHITAMSSNCYNPFLYGWLNDSFRQEFLLMMPFLSHVCGRRRPTEAAEQRQRDAAAHAHTKAALMASDREDDACPTVLKCKEAGHVTVVAVENNAAAAAAAAAHVENNAV